MPQLVLFDLDGTLISTKRLYLECYRRAVAPHLQREISDAEVLARKPRSEVRFLRELVGDAAFDACLKAFYREYEALHDSHFRGIYPGVTEMLDALRAAGRRLGIVTGKSRRSWEITAARAQLGAFDTLVFDDDVAAPKPHPDGLLLALERLRAAPAQTLYIGDGIGDVRAARAAQIVPAVALWSKDDGERDSFAEKARAEGVRIFARPADIVQAVCCAALLTLGSLSPTPARAQAAPERPRPYPILETQEFTRAVERGTRTRTGRPGENYWQQWAEYHLEAELHPVARRLSGRATVRYHNRSPDTLRTIAVHLYQNAYAPGEMRNRPLPVTGGIELTHVVAMGRPLVQREERDSLSTGYRVDGTIAWLRLPQPLPPGGSAHLEFAWGFAVPPTPSPRMGQDGEVFFLAYWYPQLAVYDDVVGWHTDPYLTNAEFYMGHGDYDVAITVPEGWLVAATGTLQNPQEVLSATTRERLARARTARAVVRVVAGRATMRGANGKLTWRFRAPNVRDFAWGTSDRYLWDATQAVAGDANGDGRPDTVNIHAFYRPDAQNWDKAAAYGRHSIDFLSRYLWPYPWPHMTSVEGLIGGGMEYPMLTLIGGARDTIALYSVHVHEIAHMWYPMMVGSDEKRHSWQDEGFTRFNQLQGMAEFFPRYDARAPSWNRYFRLARADGEVELMRHGDLYPERGDAFAVASYDKMAAILHMLRAVLGNDTFLRAYREYGRRWLHKHPKPYDFWNTIEDVAGRDLDWFWRPWFFETWTLDHAIASVRTAGTETEIVIEDRGLAPMPVRLALTRRDGSVQRLEIPVDVWLSGATRHTLRVASSPAITKVEIDPENDFLDIVRGNNTWIAAR